MFKSGTYQVIQNISKFIHIFFETDKGEIRHDEVCMDWSGNKDQSVILTNCHGRGGNQKWTYDSK